MVFFSLEYETIDLGADITDYFNFGFTEETWAQYCDRQRRLRAENNLARIAMNHVSLPQHRMGFSFKLLHFCIDATSTTYGTSYVSTSDDDGQ